MSKANCNNPVNGILLLNKPQGLTSNAVLQQIKRLYRAKKAGHTGSLDPLATGMLPVCFGEATKFSQYLLDADKCYEATGLLGIKTNTADALGEIIEEISSFQITRAQLEVVLNEFKGKIKQIPSMFSALKHKGTPLYKYAREGITIEREAREIIVHNLELTAFDGKSFAIKVVCSKGTYIRNLVEDIGERLGVGAHVTQLHRVNTAGFAEEPMYNLDVLQNKPQEELYACLLPVDRAVQYLPWLNLNLTEVAALRQGKVLSKPSSNAIQGHIRLYDECENFVGVGECKDRSTLMAKRLISA